jgi:hypothetical protein
METRPVIVVSVKSISLFGFVAQLVEQRTFNPLVLGSNPGEVTCI